MKEIIILGTGVHGGEMAEIIERINDVGKSWKLLGFITTDSTRVGEVFNGYPVLGTQEDLVNYCNSFLIPDYEWPFKEEIPFNRLVSIVDPSSFVSRTAKIGLGTVIYPNCYVGLNAQVGNFVFCLGGSIINHDCIVENYVTLASGVRLAGSVHVGEGSYMGQACTVRQLLKIGSRSLIGMGSVVLKDVPPNSVMVGNPARRLRENEYYRSNS